MQLSHCAFATRAAAREQCDQLAAAMARANKYKELSRSQGVRLAQLEGELKAQHERQRDVAREADSRLSVEKARSSAAETSLALVSKRHEAATKRIESLESQLRHAEERTGSAMDEVRDVKAKLTEAVVTAEAAVRDKDIAVARAAEAGACAEEAIRRAHETESWVEEARARVDAAEERARYAQTEVEEARARAASAVTEYKASAEFEQEVIEGSLDAFAEGFKLGKDKVAAAFNINPSDLEGIRAEDPEDEAAADGAAVEEEGTVEEAAVEEAAVKKP